MCDYQNCPCYPEIHTIKEWAELPDKISVLDIEYNVCNINKAHYLSLKHLFSFGLLDELLRQIHISFEKFILKRESAIFTLKPRFEFDKGAYFFSRSI